MIKSESASLMCDPLYLLNQNISLENLRFIGRGPRNVQFIRFSPSNIQLPIIFESSDFHVDHFFFQNLIFEKIQNSRKFANTYVYAVDAVFTVLFSPA